VRTAFRLSCVIKVDYTIEPLADGEIPARMTLAPLWAIGVSVDTGVFGSSFESEETQS
jgi:hypothetical protein